MKIQRQIRNENTKTNTNTSKYKCKYQIDSMMGDHEFGESEANQ